MAKDPRWKLAAGAGHSGAREEHLRDHVGHAGCLATATPIRPTEGGHERVKLLDDGTHGGAPPGRCSRATAHRRRRAARLIARGYRPAGGGILPPGLHKTDAEGDLGVEVEGCAQDPIESHGLGGGEDVEQPAVERELGAPEGSETWPSDADSGTEDDEEYNLYDAMMIEAQVFIREMCPGTCAVESLYNMILDSNPALEDMGEGEEGLTMLNAAISDAIEESLHMGYLELGGRDQQGAVTVRRTSRRVLERQERAAHAAPSGK